MKQHLLRFLSGCITVTLLGCEGYRVAEGIVVDKQTKRPLSGVLCESVDPNRFVKHKRALATAEAVYTDSTGAFQVHGEFGGCMGDCPDIVVRFSKKDYDTLQVENPTDSTFYLVQRLY